MAGACIGQASVTGFRYEQLKRCKEKAMSTSSGWKSNIDLSAGHFTSASWRFGWVCLRRDSSVQSAIRQ